MCGVMKSRKRPRAHVIQDAMKLMITLKMVKEIERIKKGVIFAGWPKWCLVTEDGRRDQTMGEICFFVR